MSNYSILSNAWILNRAPKGRWMALTNVTTSFRSSHHFLSAYLTKIFHVFIFLPLWHTNPRYSWIFIFTVVQLSLINSQESQPQSICQWEVWNKRNPDGILLAKLSVTKSENCVAIHYFIFDFVHLVIIIKAENSLKIHSIFNVKRDVSSTLLISLHLQHSSWWSMKLKGP